MALPRRASDWSLTGKSYQVDSSSRGPRRMRFGHSCTHIQRRPTLLTKVRADNEPRAMPSLMSEILRVEARFPDTVDTDSGPCVTIPLPMHERPIW